MTVAARVPLRPAFAALLVMLGAALAACEGGTSTGGGAGAAADNTGGAGASSSSSAGGAGGAPVSCDGLDQDACLDAYPACVPLYDDECCPSCDPGECSECTSLVFHHCLAAEEACGDAPPSCGLLPDWACSGM